MCVAGMDDLEVPSCTREMPAVVDGPLCGRVEAVVVPGRQVDHAVVQLVSLPQFQSVGKLRRVGAGSGGVLYVAAPPRGRAEEAAEGVRHPLHLLHLSAVDAAEVQHPAVGRTELETRPTTSVTGVMDERQPLWRCIRAYQYTLLPAIP